MGILLAFAPFFVFIVVERLVGVPAGLAAATATSAGLLLRDALSRIKRLKVLEIGTFLLFGGLTAYTVMVKTAWSIPAVRLLVPGTRARKARPVISQRWGMGSALRKSNGDAPQSVSGAELSGTDARAPSFFRCDSRSTTKGRIAIPSDFTFPPTNSRRPVAMQRPTSSAR